MLKSFFDTFFKNIADSDIKYVKDSVFNKIEKTLKSDSTSETQENTKLKTNEIVNEAEKQALLNHINECVKSEQNELKKAQAPDEIQEAKREFRRRMHLVTQYSKSNTFSNTP